MDKCHGSILLQGCLWRGAARGLLPVRLQRVSRERLICCQLGQVGLAVELCLYEPGKGADGCQAWYLLRKYLDLEILFQV